MGVMDVGNLLVDLYGRVPPLAREAVEGLTTAQLTAAAWPGANPIGWLLWHTARVQDHQVAEVFGTVQHWVSGDWATHFGVAPDPDNHGYGHGPAEVAAIRPSSAAVLVDYLDAVQCPERLAGLTASDLDRVVDRNYDPPVTLGVRLISVADDSLQHVGQAAYLRGFLQGS